jgi:hypothetical protein
MTEQVIGDQSSVIRPKQRSDNTDHWFLLRNSADRGSCNEPRSGDRYIAWGVSPHSGADRHSAKPRSGDRFIAWGVSPRTGSAQPREPWRGDTLGSRREPRPSALDCLSPLRGFLDISTVNPGADAPGYESVAPSELKPGLHSGATPQSFFFGVSRRIAGEALITDHSPLIRNTADLAPGGY